MTNFRIQDIVHLWYDADSRQEINRLLDLGYSISEPYKTRNGEHQGLVVCLTKYLPLENEGYIAKGEKIH